MTAFLEGFLPTIALIVFTALLPMLCMALSTSEGHANLGKVQGAAFVKFYRFQFVWNFLGLSLAGSLLNQVQAILDRPFYLFEFLATGLSHVSTTFINLLIIQICVGLPLAELARPVPALTVAIKRKLGLLAPGAPPPKEPAKFHVIWAKLMYGMTIGLAYASIAPLTTCFALIYVLICLVLYKRNLLFIYTHEAEARGSFVPSGSSMLLQALATAQLLLAAVHIAKGSVITFFLILPLLPFTYFASAHASRKWAPQLETLPLAERDLPDVEADPESAAQDDSESAPGVTDRMGTTSVKTVGEKAAKVLHPVNLKQALKMQRGSLIKPKRSPVAVSDLQIRVVARLMRRPTVDVLTGLFGDTYTQPELLHPEIVDPSPGPLKRTRLLSMLRDVPGISSLCPCLIRCTEKPTEIDDEEVEERGEHTVPDSKGRRQTSTRDEAKEGLVEAGPRQSRPSTLAIFLHKANGLSVSTPADVTETAVRYPQLDVQVTSASKPPPPPFTPSSDPRAPRMSSTSYQESSLDGISSSPAEVDVPAYARAATSLDTIVDEETPPSERRSADDVGLVV